MRGMLCAGRGQFRGARLKHGAMIHIYIGRPKRPHGKTEPERRAREPPERCLMERTDDAAWGGHYGKVAFRENTDDLTPDPMEGGGQHRGKRRKFRKQKHIGVTGLTLQLSPAPVNSRQSTAPAPVGRDRLRWRFRRLRSLGWGRHCEERRSRPLSSYRRRPGSIVL